MYLTNEESMLVVGGAFKASVGLFIYGAVVFIFGIFSGFFNTKACKLR